ncbi:autotransporter outer membrane beta-barrel domain-containing protein, partial [Sandaracinomonas limnophila]|uniref:hypothetical protein n=1 Tax=Sandaracinomonas limnophila TaxID=1862386 RepID=UPI0013E2F4FA
AATDKSIADNDKRAQDAEKAIDDKFKAEKSRVDAKELATDKSIADNDKRAQDAEKSMRDDFNTEKSRVSDKEAATDKSIADNDKRAQDAEKAIDDKFKAEKSRVDAKELATDKSIADNDKRAQDAEKSMRDDFNTEKSRVSDKEAATDKSIADNDKRAQDAEKSMRDDFNTEKSRVSDKEVVMESKIDLEIARAKGEEGLLRNDFEKEKTDRRNSEKDIDAKFSKSLSDEHDLIVNIVTDKIGTLGSNVGNDISLKANINSPTFTGFVSGLSKDMVGLSNVSNTSDDEKPISKIQKNALDAKIDLNKKSNAVDLNGVNANDDNVPTQLAVKKYVDGNVQSLTNNLNSMNTTLTSLVTNSTTALTTDITSQLALKADLESPTFTGVPQVPTATSGNSTNQIASTEFVSNSINNLSTATQTALDLKENVSNKSTDVSTDGTSDSKYTSAKAVKTYVDNKASDLTATINTLSSTVTSLSGTTTSNLATKENTIVAGTTGQYYRGDKSWQTLDKTAVGLANVDNTSDANKPVSTATQTALDLKENASNKSTDVSTDGTSDTKYTSAKAVKTYVDNKASDLTTTINTLSSTVTSLSGTTTSNLATKENTIVAGTTGQYYRGDKSWQTLDKTAVGLANVDNTSDANKPVSTATQTALDLKENASNKSTDVSTDGTSDSKYTSAKAVKTYVDNKASDLTTTINTLSSTVTSLSGTTTSNLATKENTIVAGTTGQYYRGDKSWQTLDKTAVGLANVDNTSDANKPISTATQSALDAKVSIGGDLSGTASSPAIGDGKVTTAKINDGAVTSAKIADGSIVNVDVKSDAAISVSKLEIGGADEILISNGTTNQWVTEVYETFTTSGLNSSTKDYTYTFTNTRFGGPIKLFFVSSSTMRQVIPTSTYYTANTTSILIKNVSSNISSGSNNGNGVVFYVSYYK